MNFPALPRRLHLLLTEKCNINCKHCFLGPQSLRSPHLSWPKIQVALNHYRRLGYSVLELTGGEPSLSPHLNQTVTLAKKLGFSEIAISSNGTAPHLYETLTPSEVQRFNFSLEGASPASADLIRTAGYFENTLASIKYCLSRGFLVYVVFTVNRQNIADLRPIIKLLDDIGVHRLSFNHLSLSGNAAKFRDSLSLSPPDWDEALSIIRSVKNFTHLTLRYPPKYASAAEFQKLLDSGYHCPISESVQTFIMSNGSIFSCCLLTGQSDYMSGQITSTQYIDKTQANTDLKNRFPCSSCPATSLLIDRGIENPLPEDTLPLCVYHKQIKT